MFHVTFDLDTIIMFIYMGAMLALGLYCARFIKTFEDFFVAGRRLGLMLCVGTMCTLFVGGSAVGIAGMGHDYGIGAVWYYLAYGIGFVILAVTFVVPLRAMKQFTVSDIFSFRYDERCRLVSSVITFFAWIFFFAAFVIAGARVVEALLGWDFAFAILVTAGIFTIYTSVGGMWAVTMTDVVQFFIIVTAMLVLFPVGMYSVGGISALFAATPPENISIIPIMDGSMMTGLGYVIATVMLTAPTGIIAPDVFIRVWCAKDDKTAKNTLLITATLIAIFAFMLVMLGMAAKIMMPEIEHEMALPWLVKHLLPAGISGFVLVALMSAAISGAVPELIACSSILARDIYQRFLDPNADEKKLLTVSRWLTFAVGIAGMALALKLPGFMDLTYNCYRIFVPIVLPAVAAGFYSKKTTSTSAFWSMITSGVVVVFMMIFMPFTFLTIFDPVIVGLIVSTATLFIVNRFTTPTPEQIAFVEQAQQQIAWFRKSEKEAKLAKKAAKAAS